MLAVFRSELQDPVTHLAFEEYLLRRGAFDKWALFVYRNAPCIVIGRNQNPWLECRTRAAERAGVSVLRRVSAGGAVYHDSGNLNVTLIGPRSAYEPDRHVRLLVNVLRGLGIPAAPDARHSILVEGKKVSGSAFMLTGARALQHATLLVDADLARIEALLRPEIDPDRVISHSGRSKSQPTMNLREILPGIGLAELERRIIDQARAAFGAGARETGSAHCLPRAVPGRDPGWKPLLERYASPEWRWGRTPMFEWRIVRESGRSGKRGGEVRVVVNRGRIERILLDPPLPSGPERTLLQRCESAVGEWFDPHLVRTLLSPDVP